MKNKNLALTNGIIGLIGGILLLFWPLMLLLGPQFNVFLRLALIALGILSFIVYKDVQKVKIAAPILLILSGAIAFVPFLGWIGGILAIIAGALYLASLKNF